MKKEKEAAPGAGAAGLLERIKILAIQAMFSDDDLLEKLVLKGGNAMVLIHRVSARTSVDLDFSLAQDFGDEVAAVRERIETLLQEPSPPTVSTCSVSRCWKSPRPCRRTCGISGAAMKWCSSSRRRTSMRRTART